MKRANKDLFSSRTDRVVVALSLLGLLLCAIPLLSENGYRWLFGHSNRRMSALVVGRISYAQNDIRLRSQDSLSWEGATRQDRIQIGDSLFTGPDSQSRVELTTGGRVDCGANSLVTFRELNRVEVPNMAFGNFRVAVNGSMTIAIGNELIRLKGVNSQVQVVLKEGGQPKFRLLAGGAVVERGGKTKSLKPNDLISLEEKAITPPPAARILPEAFTGSVVYTEELYDHFTFDEGRLHLRPERRLPEHIPLRTSWQVEGHPFRVFGQLSERADFSRIAESFALKASEGSAEFKNAVFGRNFIRLSADGHSWSPTQAVDLVAEPLPFAPPEIQVQAINRMGLEVQVTGTLIADPRFSAFTVEVSPDETFRPKQTRVFWFANAHFYFPWAKPGQLFLRARAVDADLKVTGLSESVRISIEKPTLGLAAAKKPAVKPEIKAPERKTAAQKPSKPKRLPTAAPKLTETLDPDAEYADYLNRNYPRSKLSLEGSGLTMYSMEQVNQDKQNPMALLAGLRWFGWFGAHGLEAAIKSKVFDVRSVPGGEVSPLQAEARYHLRWNHFFNPLSKFKRSQISWIGGYEYYRNSGTGPFSPGYNLFKTGLAFEFPFIRRWDTGGEILYGQGLDASRKYELSGHVDYYLEKDFSMGVGYRVHLFEAGSEASAPVAIPYREGYAEGYSVLRWHY